MPQKKTEIRALYGLDGNKEAEIIIVYDFAKVNPFSCDVLYAGSNVASTEKSKEYSDEAIFALNCAKKVLGDFYESVIDKPEMKKEAESLAESFEITIPTEILESA